MSCHVFFNYAFYERRVVVCAQKVSTKEIQQRKLCGSSLTVGKSLIVESCYCLYTNRLSIAAFTNDPAPSKVFS